MIRSSSEISFLSGAEKITLLAYTTPRNRSVLASEILSRLAATLLLSPGAALDIGVHTLFVLPSFVYAIGKLVYFRRVDFNLPWQHIQRVRNAVAPLAFASALGLLHPFAGLAFGEPTDKHIVLGMLSSNTGQLFETPCSPIHSLAMIEEIAQSCRYFEKDGARTEIFSPEHLKLIRDAKAAEETLESLQAQEYIHKITNLTLLIMHKIMERLRSAGLSGNLQAVSVRACGLLIPILTAADMAIALMVQGIFLATSIVRLISGRGPIYSEVTTNPLMHITFLLQNVIKAVGNLVGTVVWFISPQTGFRVSLFPAHLLFHSQMALFMLQIRLKLYFAKEGSYLALPIVYGAGESAALSVPTHSLHKTYLIVEKKRESFDLYWVNRPVVYVRRNLDSHAARGQIFRMLNERFPFMDSEKLMNYPIKYEAPILEGASRNVGIRGQGNLTNCVVSNLFGTLEAFDRIRGNAPEVTQMRYMAVRKHLTETYSFYQSDFSPFASNFSLFSLVDQWFQCEQNPNEPI